MATTAEQRKKLWTDLNRRRLPLPPPQVTSVTFLRRLLQQDLPIIVGPEDFPSTEDEEYFFGNICITPEVAEKLFFSTVAQSESAAWSAARRRRFTGSTCYKLYTPNTPMTDHAFWAMKLKSYLKGNFQGNFHTRRGLVDEPYARRRYEEVYNVPVQTLGLLIHPSMPWFGFSADGVINEETLFETKSVESGICQPASEAIRNLPYIRSDGARKRYLAKRHAYYGEVQLGLALTGLKKCHFVVYVSYDDSIAVIDVPVDPPFIQSMLTKLTSIYFHHFLPILRKAQLCCG